MTFLLILKLLFFFGLSLPVSDPAIRDYPQYAVVIHGGAGTIRRSDLTSEVEALYRNSLSRAALLGDSLLQSGMNAVDVAVEVVRLLEEDSLFNAGKGAVFTIDGQHELDASVMDGSNLMAGAVAGIKTIRNPILLAKAVMQKTNHVFLTGAGAEDFAQTQNLATVPNTFFDTHMRKNAWLKGKEKSAEPKGTVGAVVLDKYGNLAAATSTGGMTNKKWGRVGDSPIIGSGTYADNHRCAVSCTGHGEYFIRKSVAYDLAARIKYSKQDLIEAAKTLVLSELKSFGGEGGLIALDKAGNVSMHFNTEGMYRAWKYPNNKVNTAIYSDEPMFVRYFP